LRLVAVDHVVDEVVARLVHYRPDPAGAVVAIAIPALGIIVLGLGEAGTQVHLDFELLVVIAEVELAVFFVPDHAPVLEHALEALLADEVENVVLLVLADLEEIVVEILLALLLKKLEDLVVKARKMVGRDHARLRIT
jgi:hypothetical protein